MYDLCRTYQQKTVVKIEIFCEGMEFDNRDLTKREVKLKIY